MNNFAKRFGKSTLPLRTLPGPWVPSCPASTCRPTPSPATPRTFSSTTSELPTSSRPPAGACVSSADSRSLPLRGLARPRTSTTTATSLCRPSDLSSTGTTSASSPAGPRFLVRYSLRAPAPRIWWALKQAAPGMESFPYSYTPGQHFAVRLVLHLPTGEQVNLAALAKPLFDGAIAAFHHDPTPDPEVVSRLSRQLDAEPSEVCHSLANSSLAVLGSWQLVRPRLRGVQWNPADHLCVAGQLTRQDAAGGPAWWLSGELLSVVARGAPPHR